MDVKKETKRRGAGQTTIKLTMANPRGARKAKTKKYAFNNADDRTRFLTFLAERKKGTRSGSSGGAAGGGGAGSLASATATVAAARELVAEGQALLEEPAGGRRVSETFSISASSGSKGVSSSRGGGKAGSPAGSPGGLGGRLEDDTSDGYSDSSAGDFGSPAPPAPPVEGDILGEDDVKGTPFDYSARKERNKEREIADTLPGRRLNMDAEDGGDAAVGGSGGDGGDSGDSGDGGGGGGGISKAGTFMTESELDEGTPTHPARPLFVVWCVEGGK